MELNNSYERLLVPRHLLENFVDRSPCRFDHHGNCQGHNFDLDPSKGEICPQRKLQALLDPPTLKVQDIRIDVYRAGRTHSVRATHLPTGLVATCDDERSMLENRATAIAELGDKVRKLHDERAL